MKDKIIAIVTSVRFIQVLLIGIIETLMLFGVVDGAQAEGLARIIEGILGASVTIGSADSIATKLGSSIRG